MPFPHTSNITADTLSCEGLILTFCLHKACKMHISYNVTKNLYGNCPDRYQIKQDIEFRYVI